MNKVCVVLRKMNRFVNDSQHEIKFKTLIQSHFHVYGSYLESNT